MKSYEEDARVTRCFLRSGRSDGSVKGDYLKYLDRKKHAFCIMEYLGSCMEEQSK